MTDLAEVPDLPCRKCGHLTTMRFCEGTAPWDRWVSCSAVTLRPHLHRECGRCGFKWVTFDTLPDIPALASRYEAFAAWEAERGDESAAAGYRRLAEREQAKLATAESEDQP